MAIFSVNKKSLSCCILCFAKLKIEVLDQKEEFKINLDGEYGGDTPVELEVFHNHLEFFANIDEINDDALVRSEYKSEE